MRLANGGADAHLTMVILESGEFWSFESTGDVDASTEFSMGRCYFGGSTLTGILVLDMAGSKSLSLVVARRDGTEVYALSTRQ